MSDTAITSTMGKAISKSSFAVVKPEGIKNSTYTKDKEYDCIIKSDNTIIIKDNDNSACQLGMDEARQLFIINENVA